MVVPAQSTSSRNPAQFGDGVANPGGTAGATNRLAFRAALGRYKGSRLAAIRLAQGAPPNGERIRPSGSAEEITEHLDELAAVRALATRLDAGSRLAITLFALSESRSCSLAGLTHALGILGTDPKAAILKVLELGLVAIEPGGGLGAVESFQEILDGEAGKQARLRVHPAVPQGVRTAQPERKLPRAAGAVSQVRESDGLEPILRLAALWQRVRTEPLRQTQQGGLYKRDRDRLSEDPVLAGPIADSQRPIPDPALLWLALAQQVGLIERDSSGERLLAAGSGFWIDNAVHLPQMIATSWLALRSWHELDGSVAESSARDLALPHLRPALLLWLSTLGDSEWVALDDLSEFLTALWPAWSRVSLAAAAPGAPAPAGVAGSPSTRSRSRAGPTADSPGPGVLELVLLGSAYPLGLVRAAEQGPSRRRVVQLTPLGRYSLALGPSPSPRATVDQFLFVQPNFELIAFRQGLTPQLVGRLSQFAWWHQLDAALGLKLTRESVVHGLDQGLTPESMLQTLARHSQRALPPGVIDAVTNWATRREHVTFYAAATLIEFGSTDQRDSARESWPDLQGAAPVAVADRFLLVEDERAVPFDRLRLTSSRDYRRSAEICVRVERDGVSLTLDPARADLMVDAELSRFADLQAPPQSAGAQARGTLPRRFLVSPASLRRAMNHGMSGTQLTEWFRRRTGGPISPAISLLLMSRTSRVPALKSTRRAILNLPAAELLDGLLQHPATSPFLGERLGPACIAIPEEHLAPLQKALRQLGIDLEIG
jgi:hypothetical protein